MIRQIIFRFVLALLLITALVACAPLPPSAPNQLRIVATTTIIGDMVRNIAGDKAVVITLVAPGLDPHDYEPAPADLQALSRAAVVFANGAGLESWLLKIADNAGAAGKIVDVSTGLTLNLSGNAIDPHLWFNVNNAIHYAEQIRDGLISIDPSNDQVYRSNAANYVAQLKELDNWIVTQVNSLPVDRRLLITNHDTFGYFAARYGFTIVGTVFTTNGAEASPSAQQIAALVNSIKHSQVKAIFTENTLNPELANTIAQEAGIQVITKLYTDSLGPIGSPASTYIDMMRYDVSVIVDSLIVK
jgi:zinc/manganese transport system substrate-binding protein/manganese/iron transport system substrate-binding protein